ncbi:MAG: DUF167 domain-containing protein [Treponema sp.]|jgi:uncharacterized protein (TIGR00251 family)|nr:DUF167 domain-containing protein [Treponema sp.]
MAVFRVSGDVILLDIKAVPAASKTEIADVQGNRLRVKIAAAPEKGKANAELCAFLAKSLSCAKKDVVIKTGETSRLKTVMLPLGVRQRLESLLGAGS